MTRTTHKVELPDGRLLTIEGGNAQSVANLVTLKMGGKVEAIVQNEAPLAMPSMSFGEPKETTPTGNSGTEEPLAMPAMQF